MIFEYALTPDFVVDLLDNSSHVTNLLRVLQHSDAVALSSYPTKLAADVFKQIELNKQEATHPKIRQKWLDREKKADEFFQVVVYEAVKKIKRYNAEEDFELEHRRHAFEKIFSASLSFNSCKNISWLAAPDCTFFTHLHSTNVERNLATLVPILTPLLQNSNEITFVDPYFYVNQEYVDIYKKYFEIIASTTDVRSNTQSREIIIICDSEVKRKAVRAAGAPQKIEATDFKTSCENTYTPLVPKGLKVTIIRAKEIQQSIHDRFILTNIGGVMIGHGTGIDVGSPKSHTEVSLLSRKSFDFWKTIYKQNSQYFNWNEAPITISNH